MLKCKLILCDRSCRFKKILFRYYFILLLIVISGYAKVKKNYIKFLSTTFIVNINKNYYNSRILNFDVVSNDDLESKCNILISKQQQGNVF